MTFERIRQRKGPTILLVAVLRLKGTLMRDFLGDRHFTGGLAQEKLMRSEVRTSVVKVASHNSYGRS